MKYGDCRVGMRVTVEADAWSPERTGTIVELKPVVNLVSAPGARLPKGAPTVVFNMIAVRYDPPLENTPHGPVAGGVLDPKSLTPIRLV